VAIGLLALLAMHPPALGGLLTFSAAAAPSSEALALPQSGAPQTDPKDPPTQPPENPGDQGFRIGVEVNQVYLSVSARSLETGGFVKDLRKEDFRVLEDGIPQEITNFASEAVPVHVAILIDVSGSVQGEIPEFRRAVLNFVRALSSEDKVAIISFSDYPKLILNWSSDIQKIELAVNSVYSKGRTVFYDALYVTFDDLFKGVEGRKAAIVLSDGIDTASTTTFEQTMRRAIQSEAMVYFVSKLDQYAAMAPSNRLRFDPTLTDSFIDRVRREMNQMASQTGGAVLNYITMSLMDIYSRVAEELRNQYYVGYLPTNLAKDGSWRRIEIEVRRPGVNATTRAGYYAAK